jgi:hypothetical protein
MRGEQFHQFPRDRLGKIFVRQALADRRQRQQLRHPPPVFRQFAAGRAIAL